MKYVNSGYLKQDYLCGQAITGGNYIIVQSDYINCFGILLDGRQKHEI